MEEIDSVYNIHLISFKYLIAVILRCNYHVSPEIDDLNIELCEISK